MVSFMFFRRWFSRIRNSCCRFSFCDSTAFSPCAFPGSARPDFVRETSACRFLIVPISTRYSSLNSEFSFASFSFFLSSESTSGESRGAARLGTRFAGAETGAGADSGAGPPKCLPLRILALSWRPLSLRKPASFAPAPGNWNSEPCSPKLRAILPKVCE